MRVASANILIIATNGFEQSELEVPRTLLREAGAHVEIASLDGKPVTGWQKSDWGSSVPADLSVEEVDPAQYHALIIPGGQINPDILRTDKKVMSCVREFLDGGQTVAAICHGPWVLVEADALRGRKATSYHSIRKDVENAGAEWCDNEVVVSDGIITSRHPGDLQAFTGAIVHDLETRELRRRAA